jgi:hypothetical protein
MHIFLALLCLALAPFAPKAGAAETTVSNWEYNGSYLQLLEDGSRRRFVFVTPAPFPGLGAVVGYLLFDGWARGNHYSGTAYTFSKNCGWLSYPASGPVSPDQRTITLYGRAPVVGSDCHSFGYQDEVLVLRFEDDPSKITKVLDSFSKQSENFQTKNRNDASERVVRHYEGFVARPKNVNYFVIGGLCTVFFAVVLLVTQSFRTSGTVSDAIQEQASLDQNPRELVPQSMSLKLKRSQRQNAMGNVIFVLDARIALSREEYSLVRKYRLGGLVIYDSKARERHMEATRAHFDATRERPPMLADTTTQLLGIGKTLFRLGRASVSATMAALSLRITVDRLISGVHVECKSMNELLEAENAIREAGRNLKSYLETTGTFDGQEEIIEL